MDYTDFTTYRPDESADAPLDYSLPLASNPSAGGFWTPTPNGAPTTSGWDSGSIFRSISDVVSPFAQTILRPVASAFGSKLAQDILGRPSSRSGNGYTVPGATTVPRYSFPAYGGGSVGSGGGGFFSSGSDTTGGGLFASPTGWLFAAIALFMAIMILRR